MVQDALEGIVTAAVIVLVGLVLLVPVVNALNGLSTSVLESSTGDPVADSLLKVIALLLPGVGLVLTLLFIVLKAAEEALG